jgi:hypothetical protein
VGELEVTVGGRVESVLLLDPDEEILQGAAGEVDFGCPSGEMPLKFADGGDLDFHGPEKTFATKAQRLEGFANQTERLIP